MCYFCLLLSDKLVTLGGIVNDVVLSFVHCCYVWDIFDKVNIAVKVNLLVAIS